MCIVNQRNKMEILYKHDQFTIEKVNDGSGYHLYVHTRFPILKESFGINYVNDLKKTLGIETIKSGNYVFMIFKAVLFTHEEVALNLYNNILNIIPEPDNIILEDLSTEELEIRKEKAVKDENYELADSIQKIISKRNKNE